MRLVIGAFVSHWNTHANLFMVIADASRVDRHIEDMLTELSEHTGKKWKAKISRDIEYNDSTRWHDAINRFNEKASEYSSHQDIELVRVEI